MLLGSGAVGSGVDKKVCLERDAGCNIIEVGEGESESEGDVLGARKFVCSRYLGARGRERGGVRAREKGGGAVSSGGLAVAVVRLGGYSTVQCWRWRWWTEDGETRRRGDGGETGNARGEVLCFEAGSGVAGGHGALGVGGGGEQVAAKDAMKMKVP